MTWSRMEEGQNVKVTLHRSNELPETHGDKLLGLWSLVASQGEGPYFESSSPDVANGYIFFRWDRRFTIQSQKGRVNGVYNPHGHKSEVELIPYGDHLTRDFWRVNFVEDTLTLALLNVDSIVSRIFVRSGVFPED